MSVNTAAYHEISNELNEKRVALVAVSKTKPAEDIIELYKIGHRDFGENYVQELVDKSERLPKDIRWHFIGHLQSNKVKFIAPFVQLIHGVDSLKLLKEINKEARKNNRVIDCLLQVHIAMEETKFGLAIDEINELIAEFSKGQLAHIKIKGLMGMASFTDDMEKVRTEFRTLKNIFDQFRIKDPEIDILSMGMSGDYKIAIGEGSTMVRIGSLLFGER